MGQKLQSNLGMLAVNSLCTIDSATLITFYSEKFIYRGMHRERREQKESPSGTLPFFLFFLKTHFL